MKKIKSVEPVELSPDVKFYFDYLLNKYRKLTLTKQELALELSRSLSSINQSIIQGKNLPAYNKVETDSKSKNGRVVFTILNIARYLAKTQRVIEG
jgi:hypothetical protein